MIDIHVKTDFEPRCLLCIGLTIIVSGVGVDTAANGEAVARQYAMLVVAEDWPVAGELLTSLGGVVLEHQLGIEVKTNELC